jgi:hypothetical protein
MTRISYETSGAAVAWALISVTICLSACDAPGATSSSALAQSVLYDAAPGMPSPQPGTGLYDAGAGSTNPVGPRASPSSVPGSPTYPVAPLPGSPAPTNPVLPLVPSNPSAPVPPTSPLPTPLTSTPGSVSQGLGTAFDAGAP